MLCRIEEAIPIRGALAGNLAAGKKSGSKLPHSKIELYLNASIPKR